jgi:hypothetical protein
MLYHCLVSFSHDLTAAFVTYPLFYFRSHRLTLMITHSLQDNYQNAQFCPNASQIQRGRDQIMTLSGHFLYSDLTLHFHSCFGPPTSLQRLRTLIATDRRHHNHQNAQNFPDQRRVL